MFGSGRNPADTTSGFGPGSAADFSPDSTFGSEPSPSTDFTASFSTSSTPRIGSTSSFDSGSSFGPGSNSLDVYIGYLRRKTELDGLPRLIQTVRGVGYALREP